MDVHHIRTTNPTESEHDMSTTNTIIAIEDDEPMTRIETQYGMQFPDGSFNWESKFTVSHSANVHWGKLAKGGNSTDRRNWEQYLQDKAQQAKINAQDYIAGHTLVSRTIVVAVTESQNVVLPQPKSDDLTPSLNAPWS